MMADNSPGHHNPSFPELSPAGCPDDSPAIEVDFKADSPADSDRSSAPTSGLRAVGNAGEPVVVSSGRGVIDPILTSSNNLPEETGKLEELPFSSFANVESKTPSPCGLHLPPSRSDVVSSLSSLGLPSTLHPKPYCSRREDAGGEGLNLNEAAATGGKNQVGTVGRSVHLEHDGLLPTWPGFSRMSGILRSHGQGGSLARIQTVGRPPSRKEVEQWLRARKLLKGEKEKPLGEKDQSGEEEIVEPQTQLHVKVRVRRDSEDSFGSDITCSLPSSPIQLTQVDPILFSSAEHAPPSQSSISKSSGGAVRGRRISWDLPEPLEVKLDGEQHKGETSPGSDGQVMLRDCDPISGKEICDDGSSQNSFNPNVSTPVLPPRQVKRTQSNSPLMFVPTPESLPMSAGSEKQCNESLQDASNSRATPKELDSTSALLADPNARQRFLTPQVKRRRLSQIEGVSPATPQTRVDLGGVSGSVTKSHLSLLLVELQVTTRQALLPDPELDPITALFYRLVLEGEENGQVGCITVGLTRLEGVTNIRKVDSELDLVKTVVRLVRDADPDILGGWEVQMSSWGFLMARAATLGINLCPLLSRVPGSVKESKVGGVEDGPGMEYNASHTSEINLVGRTIFNLWRMMRAELTLNSYTLENVAKAALGERRPNFSSKSLTQWWSSWKTRVRVVEHWVGRIQTMAAILFRLDLLSRSAELARLFGIQLSEVFSRGSQFRVESSMLRLAKPANFVPVSPTRQQLAGQSAPEYLALLLEPESKMYTDPVVVLDFQSLYPSIMIAYNYCFTTCIGRVQRLANGPGAHEFGCTELLISSERLSKLLQKDRVSISPGGVVFLRREERRGVLPQMLEDILNTRIMVKQSMKRHKMDQNIQKLLHSRQLGLKLIANVTYGYTSANFSGRMPCIEVGDSVVAKGREALEEAIKTIEGHPKWNARVVYGDTDSVFVLLEGRSKTEAFDIGEEMARVVTMQNPKPMKLKFEKVYLPCLLQTKKRYVGYMWESRDQKKPVYDAKGIETVRRDGIPATVKILEKTLRILFNTADVSLVKRYVQQQFRKILAATVSIQELTFAKEFRGLGGYRPGACVPALELTRQAMKVDRRAVPRSGERVPYVVVYGEPGLPLIQLVRPPVALLDQPHLRINGLYYITKVIGPPLNRCLLLVGADCLAWLAELPRTNLLPLQHNSRLPGQVISQYFISRRCAACSSPSMKPLCQRCSSSSARAATLLSARVATLQLDREMAEGACVRCCGPQGSSCISLDCPSLYRRRDQEKRVGQLVLLRSLMDGLHL